MHCKFSVRFAAGISAIALFAGCATTPPPELADYHDSTKTLPAPVEAEAPYESSPSGPAMEFLGSRHGACPKSSKSRPFWAVSTYAFR